MSKDFTAHFQIQNGQIVWKSQSYIDVWLPKLEGQKGMLVIRKKFNKRSLDQNALYWVWMQTISEHTGHTPEELHHIFKGRFAPKKQVEIAKVIYNIPKGTSEMSVGEMVEMMMHVEAEAGQMGIVLPHPEDLYKS
jgi:hypothetical protein